MRTCTDTRQLTSQAKEMLLQYVSRRWRFLCVPHGSHAITFHHMWNTQPFFRRLSPLCGFPTTSAEWWGWGIRMLLRVQGNCVTDLFLDKSPVHIRHTVQLKVSVCQFLSLP